MPYVMSHVKAKSNLISKIMEGSFIKTTKKWSKKLLVAMFSLALTFGSVGGVFGASDLFNLKSGPTAQKSTIFVDVGTTLRYLMYDGIGGGVGYEKSFGDTWTGLIHAAAGLYTYSSIQSAFAFQIDVHGRYYIFKTALDKLFVDLGLGYDFYKYTHEYTSYDGEKYDWGYDQSSLTITPKVGWKFIFGKGFVVEPAFGYTIGIGITKPDVNSAAKTYTASGLNFGIGLGWAF
ncbi:hypothetical protein AGMMS50267_16610 [Spirochaetia bacterium]|nr:hypothetical protein AGMMS50267_16610 [Spirochaetia bacterium]